MKNILTLTLALLALAANTAFAEASKSSGFYLGGAVGVTELDDDGFFGSNLADDNDTSYQISGGYKFFRYFAVEARAINLGSYTLDNGFIRDEISLDALSVHAVGIVPFGESGWEIFGQLGLGRADISCGGECSDETVGSAGMGVRFSPMENLGIGFQIDAYAYEQDAGFATYDFGVATTQLSIQYIF